LSVRNSSRNGRLEWIPHAVNFLESIWLAHLSQPSCDRVLYRAIRKRRVRQIMEVGIGDLRRGLRMIRLAQRYHPAAKIRYVGVDLFEARPDSGAAAMSLKHAYRLLRATGAKVHLIPGDALQALVRSANALPGNELLLVASDHATELLAQAWRYVPRMLAPSALIYAAQTDESRSVWRPLPAADLQSLAGPALHRRAA
jgi:hypothetical protein